jgi:hypothetical protein
MPRSRNHHICIQGGRPTNPVILLYHEDSWAISIDTLYQAIFKDHNERVHVYRVIQKMQISSVPAGKAAKTGSPSTAEGVLNHRGSSHLDGIFKEPKHLRRRYRIWQSKGRDATVDVNCDLLQWVWKGCCLSDAAGHHE